jgi:hypothetical protein
MRNFSQFCRKFVAASVLVVALACSVFAGDVQYPNVTSPPPPPPAAGDVQYPAATDTPDGDMPSPGTTMDSVTGVALYLLQSTVALF